MISIELTDTKDFMNKLLRTEIFDNFLLQEAVITKAASYVIDGHLQKGFYSSTELEENGIAGYSILPFTTVTRWMKCMRPSAMAVCSWRASCPS